MLSSWCALQAKPTTRTSWSTDTCATTSARSQWVSRAMTLLCGSLLLQRRLHTP